MMHTNSGHRVNARVPALRREGTGLFAMERLVQMQRKLNFKKVFQDPICGSCDDRANQNRNNANLNGV